jgi:amidase
LLSHPLPHWQPRWPPDQEMYDLLTSTKPAVINLLFWSTFSNTDNNNNNPAAAAATTAKAHRHVLELRAAYNKALNDDVDVLITPTAPTVASKHADVRPGGSSSSSVMDKMRLAVGVMSNTCPFNTTGHPALSVPCGWGEADDDDDDDNNDGEEEVGGKKRKERKVLPIGMQIIGKQWDEMGVLRAAAVFEDGGGGVRALGRERGKGKRGRKVEERGLFCECRIPRIITKHQG